MTRVTNFGRKRTHVQAGFDSEWRPEELQEAERKLAKRSKTTKTNVEGREAAIEAKTSGRAKSSPNDGVNLGSARGLDGLPEEITSVPPMSKKKLAAKLKLRRLKEKKRGKKSASDEQPKRSASDNRLSRTELRRKKRIMERNATTTCFACREKGHAAQDCPKNRADGDGHGKKVGICYRCGSTRHTLARCQKPADPDPAKALPFASCFVCSGTGHLASTCPQNAAKGVYPNGGCCKLCGETTHLARNCGLRKDEGKNVADAMIGTGDAAGADEDDFHTLKRRRVEVDSDLRQEERVRKLAPVKQRIHTGVVKVFGKDVATPKKKAVYF